MNSNLELIASIIRMNLGGVLDEAVRDGVAEMIKQADKRRTPIADAAWFLFSVWASTPDWLRESSAQRIRDTAKVNGEAAFKMGLPVGPSWAVTFRGGGFTGMGLGVESRNAVLDRCLGPMIEACTDLLYPLREKTADAARFLWLTSKITSATQVWLNDATGKHIIESAARKQSTESMRTADAALYIFKRSEHPSWISWLINRDAESIKATAGAWQCTACEDTADAAWIAFNYGYLQCNLKGASPRDIKAIADKARAAQDRVYATLEIKGLSAQGFKVEVSGVPVKGSHDINLSSGWGGEFVENTAKEFGIAQILSVSTKGLS